MLSLEGEVGIHGCVIHVEVQPPGDEFADARDRIAVACEAIIDTGADLSCIAPELAERIGLEAHEAATVFTAGGPDEGTDAIIHRVEIALIDGDPRRTHERAWLPLPIHVFELTLHDGPIAALIGRDVLAWLRLTYDGPEGRFSITSDVVEFSST